MKRDWLIRKSGYFYRPDRSGYTQEVVAAGLYTEAEAKRAARIEDSISALHVSEFRNEIEHARDLIRRFNGLI